VHERELVAGARGLRCDRQRATERVGGGAQVLAREQRRAELPPALRAVRCDPHRVAEDLHRFAEAPLGGDCRPEAREDVAAGRLQPRSSAQRPLGGRRVACAEQQAAE
jgi:hypothetical protein